MPIKRGWGREGVRSEARAEQRLAPGGRSPHNPEDFTPNPYRYLKLALPGDYEVGDAEAAQRRVFGQVHRVAEEAAH